MKRIYCVFFTFSIAYLPKWHWNIEQSGTERFHDDRKYVAIIVSTLKLVTKREREIKGLITETLVDAITEYRNTHKVCGHLYIHTMSMRALVSSIYTACLKYIGNRIVIYRLFIQRARFISSVRCWSSMGSQLRFYHEIVIGWYCNFSNAQRRLLKSVWKNVQYQKKKSIIFC